MTRSGQNRSATSLSVSYQCLITNKRMKGEALVVVATALLPFPLWTNCTLIHTTPRRTHTHTHTLYTQKSPAFGFVLLQKWKKLNDNLLWTADATRREWLLLRSRSLTLRCVTFVWFCLFSLLLFCFAFLLHNAMLHGAHFTYFNHKNAFLSLICFNFVFHSCDCAINYFCLELLSRLLCMPILRGQARIFQSFFSFPLLLLCFGGRGCGKLHTKIHVINATFLLETQRAVAGRTCNMYVRRLVSIILLHIYWI